MAHEYLTPGYTPITSDCIPKSFDEAMDWCDEFFDGDNFEKMFQRAAERERAREVEPLDFEPAIEVA